MPSSLKGKARPGPRREVADLDVAEFCALTERAVDELLARRESEASNPHGHGRRRTLRWPFPGTVELWIPDDRGQEHYALATSVNLSRDGMGVQAEQGLAPGTCLQIAIHEPELTFHGRAVVRHCTEADDATYLIGLQFVFEAA